MIYPIDVMKRLGWAPEFLAGSILKYLRSDKEPEHSAESVRVYWRWLNELIVDASDESMRTLHVLKQLLEELTLEEIERLT